MFSKQVVTDHRCEKLIQMSSCKPNQVRKMVTHLGTHLFKKYNSNVCTMLLICIGNHNRHCLSVRIVRNLRILSYAV